MVLTPVLTPKTPPKKWPKIGGINPCQSLGFHKKPRGRKSRPKIGRKNRPKIGSKTPQKPPFLKLGQKSLDSYTVNSGKFAIRGIIGGCAPKKNPKFKGGLRPKKREAPRFWIWIPGARSRGPSDPPPGGSDPGRRKRPPPPSGPRGGGSRRPGSPEKRFSGSKKRDFGRLLGKIRHFFGLWARVRAIFSMKWGSGGALKRGIGSVYAPAQGNRRAPRVAGSSYFQIRGPSYVITSLSVGLTWK